MSSIGNKIRILRKNREWTQAELARRLSISDKAVQKWETDHNTPPLDEIRRLCEILDVPIEILTDDQRTVPEYYYIETVPGDVYRRMGDSDHIIYDADLQDEGKLHRFNNRCGVPYSAIFRAGMEIFSCEREQEGKMINRWNDVRCKYENDE